MVREVSLWKMISRRGEGDKVSVELQVYSNRKRKRGKTQVPLCYLMGGFFTTGRFFFMGMTRTDLCGAYKHPQQHSSKKAGVELVLFRPAR